MAGADDFARLGSLLELFSACSSLESVKELADATASRLRWVLDYDRFTIATSVSGTFTATAGMSTVERAEVGELPEEEVALITQAVGDALPRVAGRPATRVCHPLVAADQVIGALCLSNERRGYSHDDVRVVHHLASFLGGAFARIAHAETIQVQSLEIERTTAANRAKDEFFAILGHELRNPLAPILLAAQMLKDREGVAAHAETEIIERHALHLRRLLDDLLDVGRLSSGRFELKRAPTAIGAVIAHAVEIASPAIGERDQTLECTVPDAPLIVDGDGARLVQIVANLLLNAARYTQPEGSIGISAHRDQGEVVIDVEDNGIGISAQLLPHIFKRFAQGARDSARSDGGLGLGLGIAKSLTELHGGTISVESRGHGQGSRFQVRLPLTASMPAEQSSREKPLAARARRVVVVDDNVDAADMLAAVIRRAGHEVEVAYSGTDALALLDSRPDVWLLDISLPDIDGHELAREIRARTTDGATHLVALTGYGQAKDHEKSLEAGFDLHLVKPVDVKAVLESIARGRRLSDD